MTLPLPSAPGRTDPLVVLVMQAFRQALIDREASQITEMVNRWLQLESTLRADLELLAEEVLALQAAGQPIKISQLVKMDRYKALVQQMNAQLDGFAQFASNDITARQLEFGQIGIRNAKSAIEAYFVSGGRVAGAFDILPVEAIEIMAGLAGDGSPLLTLLKKDYPETAHRVTQALLEATARGVNPRNTAVRMADAMSHQLDRALLIARTEQLRVYREANRQQYAQSGLVRGYMRISARDDRVCPACLMSDDGHVYSLDHPFDEHPQGRCSQVPVVKGMPVIRWQTGQAWFLQQPEIVQQRILGPGRFQAWENGDFELPELVTRRDNSTWGGALVPTSLKDLVPSD